MISLTYHSITRFIPDEINAGSKHVPLELFEKQMYYISKKKLISINDVFDQNSSSISLQLMMVLK